MKTMFQCRTSTTSCQHDSIIINTHILGINDFISLYILQHTILMDTWRMCKSITTYNSFIRLNRHIHKTRYHTARRINFLSINISLNMNVIMAFNNHCHFFQRSIAGTLTNTIDCHFYLTRSVQDSINSISCRHTQVIMAMSRNNCFINTIHMIYQIFNFRTIFFG